MGGLLGIWVAIFGVGLGVSETISTTTTVTTTTTTITTTIEYLRKKMSSFGLLRKDPPWGFSLYLLRSIDLAVFLWSSYYLHQK